jgi:hypothetical protein
VFYEDDIIKTVVGWIISGLGTWYLLQYMDETQVVAIVAISYGIWLAGKDA